LSESVEVVDVDLLCEEVLITCYSILMRKWTCVVCVISEWFRSTRWKIGRCMTSSSGTRLSSSWRLQSLINCSRVS